jgi:hypothetical protein
VPTGPILGQKQAMIFLFKDQASHIHLTLKELFTALKGLAIA